MYEGYCSYWPDYDSQVAKKEKKVLSEQNFEDINMTPQNNDFVCKAKQNPLHHDLEDNEVMECKCTMKSNFSYDTEAAEILLVNWIEWSTVYGKRVQ